MSFNQNFHTKYCKKKPRLNILIFRGDIKGDMGLMGHTVEESLRINFIRQPFMSCYLIWFTYFALTEEN
jgi:hypothetical protein